MVEVERTGRCFLFYTFCFVKGRCFVLFFSLIANISLVGWLVGWFVCLFKVLLFFFFTTKTSFCAFTNKILFCWWRESVFCLDMEGFCWQIFFV